MAIPTTDTLRAAGFALQLEAGLTTEELISRMDIAFRGGDLCNYALCFFLEDMTTRRVFVSCGYSSAAQFAINHFGMGRRRAFQLIATGRRLRSLPKLRALFERDEITWSKVRRIACIATLDTEWAWIERCRDLRQEEVEALLSVCEPGDMPPTGGSGLPTSRFSFRVSLDPIEQELVEKAMQKLMAELGRGVTQKELLKDLLSMFLTTDLSVSVPGRTKIDGSLYRVVVANVEQPLAPTDSSPTANPPTANTSRVVTVDEPVPVVTVAYEQLQGDASVSCAMRRRVIERDGHHCVFCHSKRSLMIHHVVWACHGGATTESNLIALCAHCHGRVHEGFLRVLEAPGGSWMFHDREGRVLGSRESAAKAGGRSSPTQAPTQAPTQQAQTQTSIQWPAGEIDHAGAFAGSGGATAIRATTRSLEASGGKHAPGRS